MNSKPTGVRNIEVSMDNLKSWIETGLRSFGVIKDSENVLLKFQQEWEAKKIIPLQIQSQKEVEILRF